MIEIIKLDIDKNDKNNFDLVFKINDIQIAIGNYDDGCTINHIDNNDMVYVDIIALTIAVYMLSTKVIQHKAQKIHADAIQNHDIPDMSRVVDWIFDYSQKRARGIFKLHEHCIKKYGFVLPYNFSDNKFDNMQFSITLTDW